MADLELADRQSSSCLSFVGTAASRYDVDELDALGKKSSQPTHRQAVEVRRPDGTVAKSRGEKTFYGAFTGGFSAGYWNTVGSKEGWEPASFSSSRTKRQAQPLNRIEDFMDEEDLRDHQSSHRTIETRQEFGTTNKSHASAVPGGLSRELEDEVFAPVAGKLGARLLSACTSERTADVTPNAVTPSAPSKSAQKVYGCARPPPMESPAAGAATSDAGTNAEAAAGAAGAAGASAAAAAEGSSIRFARMRFTQLESGASGNNIGERQQEAELQRLWRAKKNLHGVGYESHSQPLRQMMGRQRLHMSAARVGPSDYCDFGTGVFDMEEADHWENVYSAADESGHHDATTHDPSIEDVERQPSPSLRARSRDAQNAVEDLPGFVQSEALGDGSGVDWSLWHPPPVPQGYRGVHVYPCSMPEEAKNGSWEHQRLSEFLEKHGVSWLMSPGHRAELLGEPGRSKTIPDSGQGPAANLSKTEPANCATGPLWQGVADEVKQELLMKFGRKFVVGQSQDMEGKLGRDQPYRHDAKKQERYERFCQRLEESKKDSPSTACSLAGLDLLQSGLVSDAQSKEELHEFVRVYSTFRADNSTDLGDEAMVSADSACEVRGATKFCRTVTTWTPEKLLCKRWGVHAPSGHGQDTLNQVQHLEPKPRAPLMLASALSGSVAEKTDHGAATADPPCPPKSLFTAIFGDDG